MRGLVSVPGIGFASASNDTTLRLWSLNGQQLQEMFVCFKFTKVKLTIDSLRHGHAEYIYCLAINVPDMQDSLSDMLLVSGGEERAAKIWKGTNKTKKIHFIYTLFRQRVDPNSCTPRRGVVGCRRASYGGDRHWLLGPRHSCMVADSISSGARTKTSPPL